MGALYVRAFRHDDWIEQARREANGVAGVVSPQDVEAVVCVHPAVFRTKGPHRVRGCWVVSLQELEPLLLSGPAVLTPAEVWDVADRIDRSLELAGEDPLHA